LLALADHAPYDLACTLFVNSSFGAAHRELTERFPTVVAPVSGHSRPARILAESTWLGWQCVRRRIDLVHHLGGIVPAWRPSPTILTMHDLQPIIHPDRFSFAKRSFIGFWVPRSVRATQGIVVLSAFSGRELGEYLDVAPEKVRLVPPGFDPPPDRDRPQRSQVRERYEIHDRPFFLYPAITYPHKNHLVLVRALAKLVVSHPEALLVLTGGEAQMEDEIRATITDLGLDANVRRTGRVPEADIDALFREAAALTVPSHYEGFGMPVLEAMSRRCPVIVASGTAMPEVAGGAGIVVPPDAVDRWTDAMAMILDDPVRRDELVAAGFARANQFDWSRSAEALAEVYRRAPV
jgi:glycosyltransferase involved in cell wall biosynthesis